MVVSWQRSAGRQGAHSAEARDQRRPVRRMRRAQPHQRGERLRAAERRARPPALQRQRLQQRHRLHGERPLRVGVPRRRQRPEEGDDAVRSTRLQHR